MLVSLNKQEHVIFVFLFLDYFTQHNVLQLHPQYWKDRISFLWPCSIPVYKYSRFSLSFHLLKSIKCWFNIDIVNIFKTSMGEQVSYWYKDFIFLGYILSNAIAQSHGRSILSFSRTLHIVFCNGCNLYFQQSIRVLTFPKLHPHVLLLSFIVVVGSTGIWI
jgi:hypothetical protein